MIKVVVPKLKGVKTLKTNGRAEIGVVPKCDFVIIAIPIPHTTVAMINNIIFFIKSLFDIVQKYHHKT